MQRVSHSKKIIIIYTVAIIVFNIFISINFSLNKNDIVLSYNLNSQTPGILQVFFTGNEDAYQWSEESSQKYEYYNIGHIENIKFAIPYPTKYLRIDFFQQSSEVEINNLNLIYRGRHIPLDENLIVNMDNLNQISSMRFEDNSYKFYTTDMDPYIQYEISNEIRDEISKQDNLYNNIAKLVLCMIFDLGVLLFYKKQITITGFITDLFRNRNLIWILSKNDFKTKYAGSYLGIFWAFVQPIVTILIYWFVFEYGLKAGSPITGIPFILWFIAGLVPWFFFQEALMNASNCMTEYSYLVKKVVFNINILPIVKIMSSLLVHIVFIAFTLIVFLLNGKFSGIYSFQILYYSFCCFVLVLSISYATSSIIVFFKDFGQLITILLQILMWMTPIMWSDTILPQSMHWFPFFNPVYYIVDGFRDSLINNKWFWEKPMQTLYFWFVSIILFLVGTIVFKKLRPHLADVL